MTAIPDRTVTGLPPRPTPPAGALIKSNRDEEATQVAARQRTKTQTTKGAQQAKAREAAPKRRIQVAADISSSARSRARAAFRAAAYFEKCPTWGEFVERALEAESARLEQKYNEGEPFEPMPESLPRGRRPA